MRLTLCKTSFAMKRSYKALTTTNRAISCSVVVPTNASSQESKEKTVEVEEGEL